MESLSRDPYLWQKAKSRAKFKSHVGVYVVVNAAMWAIWALTPQPHGVLPWPIWSTAFWGFGLVMRGISSYGGFNREQRTQREYERLLREQQSSSPSRF